MKLRQLLPVLGAVGMIALLSACGPYETGSTPAGANGDSAGAVTSGAPQVLTVAQVDGFAPFLVNGKGRTIYRFDKDSTKPPTTTCVDACAKTWEPVLAPNGFVVKGGGIDKELVGSINRPDGGTQLTLKGWPLYYYKDDLKLGQTAGHGRNGTWFAIAPNGGKSQRSGEGATAQPSASAQPSAKPQVLTVAQVDGFAPFVVNGKGRTIYRFDKDTARPSKTTCLDACATVWEPVLAPNGFTIKGGGIDKDLVGAIRRPDGGVQLTLKGWPLYYYKDDLKLGQTAGYGRNGTWFAIAPNGGKAAKTTGANTTTADSGYGDGY